MTKAPAITRLTDAMPVPDRMPTPRNSSFFCMAGRSSPYPPHQAKPQSSNPVILPYLYPLTISTPLLSTIGTSTFPPSYLPVYPSLLLNTASVSIDIPVLTIRPRAPPTLHVLSSASACRRRALEGTLLRALFRWWWRLMVVRRGSLKSFYIRFP